MDNPKPLVCNRCVCLIGYTVGAPLESTALCTGCGEKWIKETKEERKQTKVTGILKEAGVNPFQIAEVLRVLRS